MTGKYNTRRSVPAENQEFRGKVLDSWLKIADNKLKYKNKEEDMGGYLFEDVTAEKWLTIILIIWGVAIIWAIVTSLIKRIKSKNTEPSGLCTFGCFVFGIIGGVCTLNLVGNALKIDVGFITVIVLFIGGGIIGYSSYFIGNLIVSKNRK